jgi:hypothetical protein
MKSVIARKRSDTRTAVTHDVTQRSRSHVLSIIFRAQLLIRLVTIVTGGLLGFLQSFVNAVVVPSYGS